MDDALDIISKGLFYLAFISPVVIFILVWKYNNTNFLIKALIGILFGAIVGVLCFFASMEIVLRDGLGPG